MENYKKAYQALNDRQRQAVDQIDGPVLVIAGPGTGKTQLLSTRVGYVLNSTDALPQNILCLTFTEAGADAMRQRLTQFLGQAAYDVNISTYHKFGSDLIKRYPEYAQMYDFEPIDELGADALLREILEASSYNNPLKSADTYARDLRSFISDAKRALMTPEDLLAIARNNQEFVAQASKVVREVLNGFTRIGKGSYAVFEDLLAELNKIETGNATPVISLKTMATQELALALADSDDSGNTKSITAWKNDWLAKDGDGKFIFVGRETNRKIEAAAGIYARYQDLMLSRKLYDYDDMVLRAIKALENNSDFRFSLAEQYLYIMLDEFQDTNAAQFRIVELLTNNPVNEGSPDIMAVGDDDQAIYAFQGAELANMALFASLYKNVKIISLKNNYRSHKQILDVAHNIGSQIAERLHTQFEGVEKVLEAANTDLPRKATLEHHSFISDAAEYAWLAEKVQDLIEVGMEPNEIAILAPKHKYLIPLLPYLAAKGLPLRYEKRENILDKPITRELEQMSRLTVALGANDVVAADALWSEVLSYDFWHIPTEVIWNMSWQASKETGLWTNLMLEQESTRDIALFFLRLKDLLPLTNLEQQLDILIGANPEHKKEYKLPLTSPLFNFYFGDKAQPTNYLDILSDLSVLRGRLREWGAGMSRSVLGLADFVVFVNAHRDSRINILNSSPHHQAENAVNLMTAYQAKGREFSVVFVVAAQDEVWGGASRNRGSTISLPPNLKYIRYCGGSDDERLRLLYVALTRAKMHLYLSSYASTLDGKATRPLKYLVDNDNLIPEVAHQEPAANIELIESYWHDRHLPPFKSKLADLLTPQLDKYQLSPTHLNQFIDVIYGGPEKFFLNTILRFPKGQSPAAQYGTIIHNTLRWVHDTKVHEGRLPNKNRILGFFDERLAARRLAPQDTELLRTRGHQVLESYMRSRGSSFNVSDKFEVNFRNEGVFVGDAHLTGNIDKLSFDKKNKTITVYDYKTGTSHNKWTTSSTKLHKYRQQLMIYKMLIENSHSYKGWKVDKGVLEFVEPSDGETEIKTLELDFSSTDSEPLQKLIAAVWQHIKTLDFPDISEYPKTINGIRAFEQDLLK